MGHRGFAASSPYMQTKPAASPVAAPLEPQSRLSTDRALSYGHGLSLPVAIADSPEKYANELQRTIRSLPPEIRVYVEAYAPRSLSLDADSQLAHFIRTTVLAVAPLNKHTADQTAAAMTHLTGWAHLSKGLPLKYRLLLSSEVISRWQSENLSAGELSDGTIRNYRGHLARIAHVMGVELNSRFDPISRIARSRPYSPVELERILLWARTLPPEMNRRARVLICFGAGAGLLPREIFEARAHDVIAEVGMWVKVGESQARLAPVLDAWRPRLRALVEQTQPSDFLFPRPEGAQSWSFVKAWLNNYPSKDRPNPTRLRTSWIVEMLRNQADDSKTLAYSGIDRGETLAGYLPLVGDVDRARRSALLRMSSGTDSARAPRIGLETGDAAHSSPGGHLRSLREQSAGVGADK